MNKLRQKFLGKGVGKAGKEHVKFRVDGSIKISSLGIPRLLIFSGSLFWQVSFAVLVYAVEIRQNRFLLGHSVL